MSSVPTPQEFEIVPTDTSTESRFSWPYLTQVGGGSCRNGREMGNWIAGHLLGRSVHGEYGLRVEVPKDFVDGAVTALVAHGITVRQYSDLNRPENIIDVWVG